MEMDEVQAYRVGKSLMDYLIWMEHIVYIMKPFYFNKYEYDIHSQYLESFHKIIMECLSTKIIMLKHLKDILPINLNIIHTDFISTPDNIKNREIIEALSRLNQNIKEIDRMIIEIEELINKLEEANEGNYE